MIRLASALALALLAACSAKPDDAATVLADAVCACADLTCAQAATEKHAAAIAALGTGADEDAAERIKAAKARGETCVKRLRGEAGGDEAVKAAKAMADAVCGCADLACAREAAAKHTKRIEGFTQATGTPENIAQIKAAGVRAKGCIAALTGAVK